MPEYSTTTTAIGPVRYHQLPDVIGIMEASYNYMAAGIAHQVGRTVNGLALWRLVVREAEVPGRWILIGRRFEPARDELGY